MQHALIRATRHCPKCQIVSPGKSARSRSLTVRVRVFSCRVYAASATGHPGPTKQTPAVRSVVPSYGRNSSIDRGRSKAPGCPTRLLLHPTQLGTDTQHSSASALRRPRWGISLDGSRWVACRPRFLLPVRVLSCRFRRLYLRYLEQAYRAGKLRFHGQLQHLSDPASFARYLAPLRKTKWVVYAKPPFGGPEKVLDYLGRYTHRVAISNHRLQQLQDGRVTFAYKDYKDQQQQKLMTLSADEFLRRFSAARTTRRLPADSPLWSFQQPAPCRKPGPLPRTPRCFGSCSTVTTGLLRALPATHWTGSVAMPAVPARSDAADRCPPRRRRNRWMGQLMSNAIIYASTGRGFLSPGSVQKSVSKEFQRRKESSGSLWRCRLPRRGTLQKTILPASPVSIPTQSQVLSRLLSNSRSSKTHSLRHSAAA